MARRIKPDQAKHSSSNVERRDDPESTVVLSSHSSFWTKVIGVCASVTAILTIGSIVFYFLLQSIAVQTTDQVEETLEKEIKPLADSISGLHVKFDKLKDNHSEDRINHIKEFHVSRSSNNAGDD